MKSNKKKFSKSKIKKLTKKLSKKEDEFEEKKEKHQKELYDLLFHSGSTPITRELVKLPNPFDVVVDFIKEKGLKLYGGQALHEHLKKYKQGFYKPYQFPDYDVFSPNAWEHAKELADRFHQLGFSYAEAKSSILNDEQHQTYKVGIEMMYILDLTQTGCTPQQLKNKDCKECGLTKNKECISLFNHIPTYNLINYNPKNKETKVFYETYDFKNDKSLYPKKMFLCAPDWLKISMYRELTEPITNPSRLTKVAKRLEIFKSYFEYEHRKCNVKNFSNDVNRELKDVFKYLEKYIKDNNMINYGASAFNMFVKSSSHKPTINVSDYEVYVGGSEQYELTEILMQELVDDLNKKFKDLKFKFQEKIYYWKDTDSKNFELTVSSKSFKNNKIMTLTENITCIPYLQYNGVKYVTIDRLKNIYFRAVSLKDFYDKVETNPKNYECMLSHLIKAEEEFMKKKNKNIDKSKFKRFQGRCSGDEYSKIYLNLISMWGNRIDTLKKTKYIIDSPKKNFLTKIYPMPNKELKLPYRPEEKEIKSYSKYQKKLNKKYKK